ncbi:MurR/RpiR family transcriptional regulator [Halomonas eurihalina]|uniref:MurR/RpiR family transcriptional regulator n=1 Tax=Halomonas eurihalina TaxID=42566 RepID=A0A5D9D647_HALER|nr:MurR/RpiR family transcriptional regulator [Halomonas eurihalina]MDR5859701.1 MurR/RpiR family transcriptional regulator [Halomonas eurihalina]TZG39157.1 MurR/RpiR family transcriptional regulator [Halomonas eurihalina]
MPPSASRRPETLGDLERLLADIDDGEGSVRLGKRSRHVLTALVTAPQQAAVSSISDLAERLGVSPSTLSRLAQRLGFEGFTGLQAVFRRNVTEGKSFYSDQVSRLLDGEGNDDGQARLSRLGRQECANIGDMVAGVDGEVFVQAATALVEARRVRVHGMRQFASLASFMAYGLGMLRPDVAPLDAARHGVADALAQLDEGDVLVVASCFPYTPSVLATAEVAARQGIRLIALTDSTSSPLAKVAHYTLPVPNHSLFFSNSMCAFMLLAEGLLSEAASQLGDAGLAALKRRERLIGELDASL